MRITLALALLVAPAIAALITTRPAFAQPPTVEAAMATKTGSGWQLDVTLRHPDTGWDHYADAWQVETPDGTVLGTRALLHPHETEQPFTRSLTGVIVPPGVTNLVIRAHCKVDGWSDQTFALTLP